MRRSMVLVMRVSLLRRNVQVGGIHLLNLSIYVRYDVERVVEGCLHSHTVFHPINFCSQY